MTRLKNWTAKRSAASITVTGKDENGTERIATNVVVIRSGVPFTIAEQADGTQIELLADNQIF